MAAIKFERHITKYEIANQCLLLEDDQKKSYEDIFPTERLRIQAKGQTFQATIRNFYVKSVFKKAIGFDHEKGHMSEFFFENSVTEGKIMTLVFDTEQTLVEDKAQCAIDIYARTIEKKD
jgi:hypothetical protein